MLRRRTLHQPSPRISIPVPIPIFPCPEYHGREEAYDGQVPCLSHGTHVCRVLVDKCEVPVSGRETGESEDKAEEDDEEDNVGTERTDQEDEAHKA